LEEHLATLGLDVGTESDYAALDKTATGGKNRKTAVFYDLNNNKPAECYDLSTLNK
jgi:NADH:ubiquinone oxidoreductase subunit D